MSTGGRHSTSPGLAGNGPLLLGCTIAGTQHACFTYQVQWPLARTRHNIKLTSTSFRRQKHELTVELASTTFVHSYNLDQIKLHKLRRATLQNVVPVDGQAQEILLQAEV